MIVICQACDAGTVCTALSAISLTVTDINWFTLCKIMLDIPFSYVSSACRYFCDKVSSGVDYPSLCGSREDLYPKEDEYLSTIQLSSNSMVAFR